MKTSSIFLAVMVIANPPLRAQIVADGATNTLSNVTNTITGDVTVGTNGSFTLLVLSDNALLTNSANGLIGRNTTAKSNEVRLTSASARWRMGGSLYVGSNGAMSRLVVSNGALVENAAGSLARTAASSNNFALVTGGGSVWSNRNQLDIGGAGPNNQMIVSNGGRVASVTGVLGRDTSSSSNLVLVTGSGSVWSNALDLFVGNLRPGNRLVIEAGGLVSCENGFIGVAASANNSEALVTGPGSLLSARSSLTIGNSASFNRLVVSNGATVRSLVGRMGSTLFAAANEVVVTGAGSTWSNSALTIGTGSTGNRVEVNDGGGILTGKGTVGDFGNNNTVILRDFGSVWNSQGDLIIGDGGGGNMLVASNGATVLSSNATIGASTSLGNNNLGLITGAGTIWSNRNDFTLGNFGVGNQLVVSNGATVVSSNSVLGFSASSSSNTALVTGAGSIWSNRSFLHVGESGSGNRLVLSNGGMADNEFGILGFNASSSNNEALVTGAGSLWSYRGNLYVGHLGNGNRLVISNSGGVFNPTGFIGYNSSNNQALVTGPGSFWTNVLDLYVGVFGRGNRLVVSNGGVFVSSTAVYVGLAASSANNRVVVDSGTLQVTNVAGTGVLDVRNGTNVLNAGLIDVDQLLLTNAAGLFEFNGGTLSVRNSTVNNGQLFHVGNGVSPATFTLAGNGIHSFGNGLSVSANAMLTGNGTLKGGLVVVNGGTLSPGASVGQLVLSNSPALQGATIMEISKNGLTLTNDQIQVIGALTYGGSLTVSNLGPTALAAGDNFQLFAATNYTGSFSSLSLPALNPSLAWTNKLLVDGSIEVITGPPGDRFWTNTLGGAYEIPANWLDNIVPQPQDSAYFTNNASYQVMWPADTLAANAYFNATSGTVTQAIGAASWTLTNRYVVGRDSVATAAVTHVSGALRVTNSLGTARFVVGQSGRGTYNLSGGEVIADSFLVTNGSKSVFNFTSGALRTRNTTVLNGAEFVVGTGASAATLELLGNGTHAFTGGLRIQTNSLLTGNGTVSGNLSVAGSISPGASIGKLTVSVLNLTSSSTSIFELNKAASTNDNIASVAGANYAGALIVSNLSGTLASGDRFQLFTSSSYLGSFSSVTLPALDPGLSWKNNLRLDGSLEVVTTPARDFGVDVSHFQGESGVSQASWNQMFAEGKRFVFIKATEGLTGPHDGAMSNNVARATAAGLLAGVYHFAHPENRPTTNGAILEASNMVVYAGSAIGPGLLRPVLDLERGANLTTSDLTDWVIAFSNEIIARRGPSAAPIIYCSQTFANSELDSRLANYDLWIRTVGSGVNPEADDPPAQGVFTNALGVFNNWSFWQYSATGSSGGISPLDLNVCHSEYKPLNSFLIPTPPPTTIILTGMTASMSGAFQIGFTNTPGATFTVLATTNVSLPLSDWTTLGAVTEISPGQFEFTDPEPTNHPQRFYLVRSP